MISSLKGVEKEGKDPLSEKPQTLSMGSGKGRTPSAKACCYFNATPCPHFPFGLSYSERGQVVGDTRVSIWALLNECSSEGALLTECSRSEGRGY